MLTEADNMTSSSDVLIQIGGYTNGSFVVGIIRPKHFVSSLIVSTINKTLTSDRLQNSERKMYFANSDVQLH